MYNRGCKYEHVNIVYLPKQKAQAIFKLSEIVLRL